MQTGDSKSAGQIGSESSHIFSKTLRNVYMHMQQRETSIRAPAMCVTRRNSTRDIETGNDKYRSEAADRVNYVRIVSSVRLTFPSPSPTNETDGPCHVVKRRTTLSNVVCPRCFFRPHVAAIRSASRDLP